MSVTGIIAEFNPLHKGHEYLINKAKKTGPVVCVMSGDFVQRGDTAIAEKGIRTLAALQSGVDLVLELPVLWAMSTAQNFALGAVSILDSIGCDKLIFGSESGQIKELEKAAQILNSTEFSSIVREKIKSGITFAKAREEAAQVLGIDENILKGANNNLGVEYICAAKKINSKLEFETVKRKGAAHDALVEDEFVSASLLRQKLLKGDREFCEKYMSKDVLELFESGKLSDIAKIENAILAVLRTKTIDELKQLPDVSEGIENKLFDAIKKSLSLDELYENIKVKRYTLARIRRLVLSAFMGADNSFFMQSPPYIRVLGFNKTGEALLRENVCKSRIPVVMKVSEIDKLSDTAKNVFSTECLATDLFALSLNKSMPCSTEYTRKLIKIN